MADQALQMPSFDLRAIDDNPAGAVARKVINSDDQYVAQQTEKILASKDTLEAYDAVQHLQLTKIQFELLEAITADKLHEASLRDIVGAFKILKDKELVAQGKPTEIHGLVGYLEILEREEVTGEVHVIEDAVVAATPALDTSEQLSLFAEEPEEQMPCL